VCIHGEFTDRFGVADTVNGPLAGVMSDRVGRTGDLPQPALIGDHAEATGFDLLPHQKFVEVQKTSILTAERVTEFVVVFYPNEALVELKDSGVQPTELDVGRVEVEGCCLRGRGVRGSFAEFLDGVVDTARIDQQDWETSV